LAKLIYSGVNVLVLDEPTNHLDIPSREALEEALEAYEGTIVTISHDRFFLDRVSTQILALDGVGNVEHYNGDYTEYHDWKAARARGKEPPAASGEPSVASDDRPSGRAKSQKPHLAASERNRGAKSEPPAVAGGPNSRVKVVKKPRASETVEAEIAELEKQAAELSNEMSTPEIARNITKLVAANEAYEQAQARLAELYDEWERAEAATSSVPKKTSRR
jgi:ATP-binding cassette subfamily F protein 3